MEDGTIVRWEWKIQILLLNVRMQSNSQNQVYLSFDVHEDVRRAPEGLFDLDVALRSNNVNLIRIVGRRNATRQVGVTVGKS